MGSGWWAVGMSGWGKGTLFLNLFTDPHIHPHPPSLALYLNLRLLPRDCT